MSYQTLYKTVRVIAAGSFGHVYEGIDLSNGEKVAIKIMPLETDLQKTLIGRELQIMKHLSSQDDARKYVPLIRFVEYTDTTVIVIMDYIDGISLSSYIFESVYTNHSICTLMNIMIKLCLAVYYLHRNGVMHRDIKTDNILIVRDNLNIYPVLIDFGLSCSVVDQKCMEEAHGTPEYAAPELYEEIKLTEQILVKSDIYSLGCTFYRMISGKELDPIFNISKNEKLNIEPKFFQTKSDKLNNVFASMLKYNYKERPDIIDICKNLMNISETKPPKDCLPISRVGYTDRLRHFMRLDEKMSPMLTEFILNGNYNDCVKYITGTSMKKLWNDIEKWNYGKDENKKLHLSVTLIYIIFSCIQNKDTIMINFFKNNKEDIRTLLDKYGKQDEKDIIQEMILS
jgi:serine/threonine protein kinase